MPTAMNGLRNSLRWMAAVMALVAVAPLAQAQPAQKTPRQLIDALGVEMRSFKAERTHDQAEQAAADQITALIGRTPGDASLTDPDELGRTPLSLAVASGYGRIVKALLADASVRSQIDAPDANGETAWMVANFAPALTLIACQPATLTLERYPLLQPYLVRMTVMMRAEKSVSVSIIQALEAAGAQPAPEAARQAWLARCPNARPELQTVIATQPLLPSLVNESLDQLMHFNKASQEGRLDIPQKPPEGMQFILVRGKAGGATPAPTVLNTQQMKCARKAPPALRGSLGWSGSLLLKVRAATRAGIVEVADFSVLSPGNPDPRVVDFFRGAVVRALSAYQCEGDHVFEQEFQFNVE